MASPIEEFERFPAPALYLPGTICLPALKTVGILWLTSPEFKTRHGIDKDLELLAIRANPSQLTAPHQSVTYFVRLEHVTAIFFTSLLIVNFRFGEWQLGPTSAGLRAPGFRLDQATRLGVVFVAESAPVLTHATGGTTAGSIGEPVAQFGDGGFGGCDRRCP